MTLTVNDEILASARISPKEIFVEASVNFYSSQRMTLAQAATFSGMDRLQFQHLLASRLIPINFGVDDLKQDVENLKTLCG
jgi:predicted HTH domain antitoxin